VAICLVAVPYHYILVSLQKVLSSTEDVLVPDHQVFGANYGILVTFDPILVSKDGILGS